MRNNQAQMLQISLSLYATGNGRAFSDSDIGNTPPLPPLAGACIYKHLK